jgi:predicted membrane channel-forming protein YqfA (hemolysin III family)
MFRLIRLLSTPEGRRVLFWLLVIGALYVIGSVIYASFNPPPSYTRPSGKVVTTLCITYGKDCDENGFVRLWTDTARTNSNFVRSPQASFCVATKSTDYIGEKFWWIDCGLWQGNQLPVIEGWVSEKNLKFTGESIP